jgi:transposase
MQDRELYQKILGLEEPWGVEDVELLLESGEIRVRISHPSQTKFCCPECQRELSCYDHGEERLWRHLDSCQFKTYLVAAPPRVQCPEHGVKTARVPWAEPGSRFTILFERFAIDLLQVTQTVKGAQEILRTNWDQTWNVVQRAVARGLDRKQVKDVPRLGIDEKAFRKGQDYITLLVNLDTSTVEAIADGNSTESANACFSQLSSEQLNSVKAIAMDMSAAFVKAAKESIPLAEEKIVHDRFHIMQMANQSVDQIRRAENKELLANGDDSLKGTRYLWLTGQENLTAKQSERFEASYRASLKTGKAWGFKELLRDLWNHDSIPEAKAFFDDWFRRVIRTNLTPLKKVARAIKERLSNVINYCLLEITNAVAEGLNSKIMSIKRRVGGFRNRENFKTAILFYCGGLDLHPR